MNATFFSPRRLLAGLLALAALGATPLHAGPIVDAAKAKCLVGERTDGYLGVVAGENPDAEVQREMREINQKRASAYRDLAERNGVTPAVAAKATAEKLINSAPSGNCVQNAGGEWIAVP